MSRVAPSDWVPSESYVRDGIYKNLPLGRGWKSLLKSCEREKERADTARLKAVRAITSELGVEVSPKFVHSLLEHVRNGESLLPGFRGINCELSCRDLGGTNSPFENNILATVKRLEFAGLRGRTIVDKAFYNAINDLKQRRLRHMEQHCLLNGGTKMKPVIEAARNALRDVDTSAIADQVIRGERPKSPRVNRPIDLDEDLKKVN